MALASYNGTLIINRIRRLLFRLFVICVIRVQTVEMVNLKRFTSLYWCQFLSLWKDFFVGL